MFEVLVLVLFVWLMCKAVGLAFRLTWGLAKFAAAVLMVLALPALLMCVVFVGGAALLVPRAMAAGAVGLLKACL